MKNKVTVRYFIESKQAIWLHDTAEKLTMTSSQLLRRILDKAIKEHETKEE